MIWFKAYDPNVIAIYISILTYNKTVRGMLYGGYGRYNLPYFPSFLAWMEKYKV